MRMLSIVTRARLSTRFSLAAVREQRINERKSAESKQEGPSEKASKAGPKREKRAASKKDQEMDQELGPL